MKYSIIFLALLSFGLADKIKYDNFQVFDIYVKNLNEVKLLQSITDVDEERAFLQMGDTPMIGKSYPIAVSPKNVEFFVKELKANKIAYRVVEKNLQKVIEADEIVNKRSHRRSNGEHDWTSYQTLDEVNAWLDKMVKEHKVLTPLVGGETYEKRQIRGVKLSHKEGNPGIFIEGGIHAREWITVATTTFMLNELLTSQNETIKDLAQNYDWYFFPSVNPDGYVYTHAKDRLWRKTRKPYGKCVGADPNRNWDFHWNEVGTSDKPCSDIFAGPEAFSEVETKSLSNFVKGLDDIKVYLAFHSYSQLILFPYGYTDEHAPNHDDLQQVGDAAKDALARRYGTKYTVGNIYDAIYPAAGASMEWAYGALDVKLAYTYELRPAGNELFGFVLPPEQIIPTSLETLDSVVALVHEGEKLGYFKQ
ncbi:zinc carboxypeptidase-like [Culicoides brevitarsis]|uniref:zinc carboxypeptidase-like n=1 Tax=Culicoides brevitarsis TaxID=469753 RepID=UPI00307B33C3